MAVDLLQSFVFLPETIENTPSRLDGIDEKTETLTRAHGCELIQEAGILLRFTQVVMATGQVLLHRFYYRQSMKEHKVFNVAMGAIFLAAKVQEQPRNARSVLNVFYRMVLRRQSLPIRPLDIYSEEYALMKNQMIMTERYILKELGFVIHVELPHKFLLNYTGSMLLDCDKELTQEAWNFLNDSLRTTACIIYPPEALACTAIFMAARYKQHPLPENPPWWELFDTSFEDIKAVATMILDLYTSLSSSSKDMTICNDVDVPKPMDSGSTEEKH